MDFDIVEVVVVDVVEAEAEVVVVAVVVVATVEAEEPSVLDHVAKDLCTHQHHQHY